jgi:hypothetical protein
LEQKGDVGFVGRKADQLSGDVQAGSEHGRTTQDVVGIVDDNLEEHVVAIMEAIKINATNDGDLVDDLLLGFGPLGTGGRRCGGGGGGSFCGGERHRRVPLDFDGFGQLFGEGLEIGQNEIGHLGLEIIGQLHVKVGKQAMNIDEGLLTTGRHPKHADQWQRRNLAAMKSAPATDVELFQHPTVGFRATLHRPFSADNQQPENILR